MKKLVVWLFLAMCLVQNGWSISIERVEPLCWWTGMKNPELQIMVCGKDIGGAQVEFDYAGVTLKETVRLENPDYLLLYLNISPEAKPGQMKLVFKQDNQVSERNFELKARNTKPGAAGFSPADVMYLITPDRFANADSSNDNLDEVKVDRSNANARHGGDLRGIINRLDYIQDLGFTTIWLNPVLENRMPGGSYHGYAITDFYHVDPRFGTNEEYCELIDKAHQKGMKIVMDMIFNHCGSAHPWVKNMPSSDWLNNGGKYTQTTHYKWTVMDIHAPETEKTQLVDGWFSPGMPDLNQRNRHLARYLIQNSIWWIEYARIDGIRQDTHPYADYDFMAEWCKEVLAEYPDFNIVGEGWYPRGTASAWWQRNSLLNKNNSNLKTVMDFNLTFAAQQAFSEECSSQEGGESGLFKLYEVIAQDFMYPDPDNILTFLDNHDLGRFMLEGETDLRKYKQGLAFLLTTRGIPQIYYGTEILMTGTKAEGDGQIRKDFPGGWQGDKTDAFTEAGRTKLQNEAWNYLHTLLNWRKGNDAVKKGQLVHYTPDASGCYVYARIHGSQKVLVILNGTNSDKQLETARFREVIGDSKSGRDIISGKEILITSSLAIPARGVYILEL